MAIRSTFSLTSFWSSMLISIHRVRILPAWRCINQFVVKKLFIVVLMIIVTFLVNSLLHLYLMQCVLREYWKLDTLLLIYIMYSCFNHKAISYYVVFKILMQAGRQTDFTFLFLYQACTSSTPGFLKLLLSGESVCVHVCVCPQAIINY